MKEREKERFAADRTETRSRFWQRRPGEIQRERIRRRTTTGLTAPCEGERRRRWMTTVVVVVEVCMSVIFAL